MNHQENAQRSKCSNNGVFNQKFSTLKDNSDVSGTKRAKKSKPKKKVKSAESFQKQPKYAETKRKSTNGEEILTDEEKSNSTTVFDQNKSVIVIEEKRKIKV